MQYVHAISYLIGLLLYYNFILFYSNLQHESTAFIFVKSNRQDDAYGIHILIRRLDDYSQSPDFLSFIIII